MSTDKLDPNELDNIIGMSPFDDDDFDGEKTTIGDISDVIGQEYSLQLVSPQGEHDLHLSPFLMGRDARNHLPMKSRRVSRFHAIIYRFGKHYYLRDLHSTNGSYINRVRVMQSILRPGDQIQLGDWEFEAFLGESPQESYHKEAIVIFMDLQNSTAHTEKHGEAFTAAVQKAFDSIEDKLLIRQGCPIKHLGDGLMCAFHLWPVSTPEYSAFEQAIAFAKEAVKTMASIKAFPNLHLRVGLHFGAVSLADKDDLDIFGDSVNLSSRLEEANKSYGSYILMSDVFRQALPSDIPNIREVDTIYVQGKAEPTTVFTWDFKELPEGLRRLYSQALSYYRQGAFEAALPLFEQVSESKDTVAQALFERTKELITAPPEKANWTGVWSVKKS